MGEILQLRGVGQHAGPRRLFRGLDLVVHDRDRVGLIGPNGAGKSTLLRILAGDETPHEGERTVRRGLRAAWMLQEPQLDPESSVRAFVEERLRRPPGPPPGEDPSVVAARELDRAGFEDSESTVGSLSGGWGRRLAALAEIATAPDLLLLDEPTNHLDLEGIEWLESTLARANFATVVISHDRRFLETVVNRVVEIDPRHPAGLLSHDGSYSGFLERRAQSLDELHRSESSLRAQVREDIRYLRQGPKARTSKSASRVARAHARIDELEEVERLTREQAPDGAFQSSGRQTRRLLAAEGADVRMGDRLLIENLDLVLGPGRRLGVVGPNGSGKSTLLRTLLGEIDPAGGELRRAPHLKTVYFDQRRERLDSHATVAEILSPEGDTVHLADRRVHVKSWARQLGFRDEQLEQPARSLSGGERARVLIGRLMSRSGDLLLLDEPTNDLDLPTLEMLERSLLEFPGALVLVTHDRFLLDRVCTSLLALSGEGNWAELADREQWGRWKRRREKPSVPAPDRSASPSPDPRAPRPAKLSYNEQRELDQMEERILQAEEQVARWESNLADPEVQSDAGALHEASRELERAQFLVDELYARWSELDAKRQARDEDRTR